MSVQLDLCRLEFHNIRHGDKGYFRLIAFRGYFFMSSCLSKTLRTLGVRDGLNG